MEDGGWGGNACAEALLASILLWHPSAAHPALHPLSSSALALASSRPPALPPYARPNEIESGWIPLLRHRMPLGRALSPCLSSRFARARPTARRTHGGRHHRRQRPGA